MPWPNPADYQEVIQHPETCFADPELKGGTVIMDALGLPIPISGAFATVYQMDCSGIKHAVRCLLRDYPDIEARYSAISSYLRQVKLPYTAEFEFLPQGVRVRGQWYPILKMEWVNGEPLNAYVQKNFNNRAAILSLASKFQQLVCDLDKASIAHGDLQHGNILVWNGQLRLVDYDGMYVPALAGMKSNELGHRNFQHPHRSATDYGPYLDHFSEWVIFTSLVALAIGVKLPSGVLIGSDNLLFQCEDFTDPDHSLLLYALEQSTDLTVRSLVSFLLSFINTADLTRIPILDSSLTPQAMDLPTPVAGPNWWQEYVHPAPVPADMASDGTNKTSWILEHLDPVTPVQFVGSCGRQRMALAGTLVLTALVSAGLALGMFTSWLTPTVAILSGILALDLAAGVAVAVLVFGYGLSPETKAKYQLLAERDRLRRQPLSVSAIDRELKQKVTELEERGRRQMSAVNDRQRQSASREKVQRDEIERKLQSELSVVDASRRTCTRAETEEIDEALRDLQSQAMERLLEQDAVAQANLPGIGPKLKQRLIISGIRTAADICDVHVVSRGYGRRAAESVYIETRNRQSIYVQGIGRSKAEALRAWRQRKEYDHQADVPRTLPTAQENQIKSKYQPRRLQLNHQETQARDEASKALQSVGQSYKQERDGIAQEILAITKEIDRGRQELVQQSNEKKKHLAENQWKMARLERDLKAYDAICFARYLKRILLLAK